MSKKKNKKVADGGSEKNSNSEAVAAVNEQQKEENTGKGNQKSDGAEKKENNGGGGGNAVLMKTDLHCEGCAGKVYKFVRAFPGVEGVKLDLSSGKIMVNGKSDPVALREKLEEKTHRKVELLSPVPKKDKENAKEKDGSGDGKGDKKKDANGKDQKNPKEPPVTTAVLKVPLHCEGCIQKIHRIVAKTKGFAEIKIDKEKDLVSVKGAMDMKSLADNLKKHLKRNVEIVPPKKDDKKEKGNAEGGGGGGEKKVVIAAGGGGGGDGVERMEGNRMQVQQFGQQQFGYGLAPPPAYGYPGPGPGPGHNFVYGGGPAYHIDPYQYHYHAPPPQMFSDENPNACSVM